MLLIPISAVVASLPPEQASQAAEKLPRISSYPVSWRRFLTNRLRCSPMARFIGLPRDHTSPSWGSARLGSSSPSPFPGRISSVAEHPPRMPSPPRRLGAGPGPHAACGRSFRIRTRLKASAESWKQPSTSRRPLSRARRIGPTVFIHPNDRSIHLRRAWLIA